MNTAARLGVYVAGLAVVFGGAYVAAAAVVPQSTVDHWTEEASGHEMSTDSTSPSAENGHGGGDHAQSGSTTAALVPGVTSALGGYLLSPVIAPESVGERGRLSFQIRDARGEAVTRFTTSHQKKLHLIVVRTDGTQFRHVHPTLETDGTWSLPWEWAAAGTYRIYADFVPAAEASGDPLTLTRTVDVAGALTPASAAPNMTASVDGFTVDLTGDLAAGSSSELTFAVSKDGHAVTSLQPYLGAFGHLVALREGDLAYLHVHPEGDEPAGERSGPEIGFAVQAPTPGRYLLYLDFQVEGNVHSAAFVVDTNGSAKTAAERTDHSGTESGNADGHGH